MKPIQLDPQQRQELERRRHDTHDKRIYERLCAVLWVADGKTRFEVADLLGCSVRQLADWLRLFRNRGLDTLCTLSPLPKVLPLSTLNCVSNFPPPTLRELPAKREA